VRLYWWVDVEPTRGGLGSAATHHSQSRTLTITVTLPYSAPNFSQVMALSRSHRVMLRDQENKTKYHYPHSEGEFLKKDSRCIECTDYVAEPELSLVHIILRCSVARAASRIAAREIALSRQPCEVLSPRHIACTPRAGRGNARLLLVNALGNGWWGNSHDGT